jgi:hypothetical protein
VAKIYHIADLGTVLKTYDDFREEGCDFEDVIFQEAI